MKSIKQLSFLVFAILVGSLAMLIAWQHNPQCEIHCGGLVNWSYWLLIGVSWAVPTYVLMLLGSWVFTMFKGIGGAHSE